MNSHDEVKHDPQDARLKDALDLLRKEGILNQEEALSEDDEEDMRSFTQKIKTFLLEHIEYVHIAASMIIIKHKAKDGYKELLEKNVKEGIQWALNHNAQHAAPLALAKLELETEIPLFEKIRTCIEPEYLIQHAQHAYGLIRAMKKIVINKDMNETIKAYLTERAEYARQFARAIVELFERGVLDISDKNFLTSEYVIFLDQCPIKRRLVSYAQAICNLQEAGMRDQDHIDIILKCNYPAHASSCMAKLKKADDPLNEGKEVLCTSGNKLLIIEHPYVKQLSVLIGVISKEIGLNKDNFTTALRYARFSNEIINFIYRCKKKDEDQEIILDNFIKVIDRQVELQPGPFLQGNRAVNATTVIGSFFRRADPNLCKHIFSFVPNPKIPRVEFKK